MGRQDHVGQRPERAVGRQWLGVGDVEPRPADLPVLECGDQRVLVDAATAADVEKIRAALRRRFELVDDKSSKFWEIEVRGDATIRDEAPGGEPRPALPDGGAASSRAALLIVCFGRIGTDGMTKEKAFTDAAAAQREADKLIAEKTGKGYREV